MFCTGFIAKWNGLMKNIIALVDSGVKKENCVRKDKTIIDTKFNTYNANRNFHGTLCTSIIQDVNEEADIRSIEILDENERTNYKKLQEVLEYLKNIDVKIINLSMATINKKARTSLQEVCDSLVSQGKIIVAAVDNLHGNGYPASLKNVIGVKGLRTMCKNEFWYNEEYTIQCACDMSPVLVPIDGRFSVFAGTSKATAIISGKISRIINQTENNNYKSVQKALTKLATENRWNNNQRYLDSRIQPSFSYVEYENKKEELRKVIFAFSNAVGYELTMDQILSQDGSLLKYGLNCDNGCKFLSLLESVFSFKINKPVPYYQLLNVGAVLGLVEEFKNEKLEKII